MPNWDMIQAVWPLLAGIAVLWARIEVALSKSRDQNKANEREIAKLEVKVEAQAVSAAQQAVFVKHVVRRFHAASLISGALISVSGLSQTGPAGCQLRVFPDQRCGFCARAFA